MIKNLPTDITCHSCRWYVSDTCRHHSPSHSGWQVAARGLEDLNVSLKRLTRKGDDKNLTSIQSQHVYRLEHDQPPRRETPSGLERTAIRREDAWHPHRLNVGQEIALVRSQPFRLSHQLERFRLGWALPASLRCLRGAPLPGFARLAGAAGAFSVRGKIPVACGKSSAGMSAPPFNRWQSRQ